jgi:hypothetical protein
MLKENDVMCDVLDGELSETKIRAYVRNRLACVPLQ